MSKKTKGRKICNLFEIVRIGSTLVGCMAWETPFVEFKSLTTGEVFKWTSNDIDLAVCFIPLLVGETIWLEVELLDLIL